MRRNRKQSEGLEVSLGEDEGKLSVAGLLGLTRNECMVLRYVKSLPLIRRKSNFPIFLLKNQLQNFLF